MQEVFVNAFVEELEKLAAGWKPENPRSVWQRRIGKRKYPISQAFTSRRIRTVTGLSGGVSGAVGGGVGTHAARWIEARALKGRMRKGGKGLWGFEKRRLAEMANIPEKDIMPLLKRIQAESGGKKKYPISRFMTGTIPTLGASIPNRAVHARALTGRATASKSQPALFGGEKYKHFLKQEKDIVKMLKEERASMKGTPTERLKSGLEAAKAEGSKVLKGLKGLKKAASCDTPGKKIKSEGKGKGLALGKGKGPMGMPKKAATAVPRGKPALRGESAKYLKAFRKSTKLGNPKDAAKRLRGNLGAAFGKKAALPSSLKAKVKSGGPLPAIDSYSGLKTLSHLLGKRGGKAYTSGGRAQAIGAGRQTGVRARKHLKTASAATLLDIIKQAMQRNMVSSKMKPKKIMDPNKPPMPVKIKGEGRQFFSDIAKRGQ